MSKFVVTSFCYVGGEPDDSGFGINGIFNSKIRAGRLAMKLAKEYLTNMEKEWTSLDEKTRNDSKTHFPLVPDEKVAGKIIIDGNWCRAFICENNTNMIVVVNKSDISGNSYHPNDYTDSESDKWIIEVHEVKGKYIDDINIEDDQDMTYKNQHTDDKIKS